MQFIYTRTGTKAKLKEDYSYLVQGLEHLIKGKYYIIRYANEAALHDAIEEGSLSMCLEVMPCASLIVPFRYFN